MKIGTCIILSAFTLLFAAAAFCGNPEGAEELFYQGNAHYSEERFEEAITRYEEALDSRYESGPLYYNLGNAYFKHGALGKAILNYLRAERLLPNDADLKANLDYARSLVRSAVTPPRRGWLMRVFLDLAGSFSLDKITVLSSVLYVILCSILVSAILVRGLRKNFMYIAGPVIVLLGISLSIFFMQFRNIVIEKEAVLVVQRSDAKFEPFIGATTFFTLSEGESVSVLSSKKDWVKIRRVDGKQGWIKESDIDFL